MADLLRIATSGLLSYQGALTTTGHNIASANVEGYNRQRADLVTRPGQQIGNTFFGSGVDLAAVTRQVDQFVTAQLRVDASSYRHADTLRAYNEQIDALLADPSIGLSGRIDEFFGALQTSADDPRSLALRDVVLSQAATLADRFRSMYARLQQIGTSLNARLDATAGQITTLASNIADLNGKIQSIAGTGATLQPNDLLDQRDRLIQQLSGLIDVRAVADGNAINLFLGRGQALVIGKQPYAAVTVPDRFDPQQRQLALEINGARVVLDGDALGGEVGGLLAFRDQVLEQTLNSIGRVALGIARDVNEQNRLGMDLDADLGGLVFADVNEQQAAVLRARPASDNDPASSGGVRVFIDDPAQLSTSSYVLDIGAGGSWRLVRNADSALVASGAGPLTDTLVSVDGFTLDLNLSETPPGNFLDGDSFIIEPTRRGAQFLRPVMNRAEDLAFALPVITQAASGNVGTGSIDTAAVFDLSTGVFAQPGQLSPPLLIRFTGATQFSVLDARTSAVLVSGLPFAPGVANTLFSRDPLAPDYFGFQLRLDGAPVAGDAFLADYNGSGFSDNRNAQLMAQLQTDARLADGSASYQQAYAQMVAGVGSATQKSRADAQAGLAVLQQSQDRRESYSGVNLDEEAANLIRFEQAYNASAQVISIARSVIDSLFDAIG